MQRVEVASTAVRAVAYSGRGRYLDVTFRSGGAYRYHGVPPRAFGDLLHAPSIGAYVNTRIKPRYPFTRLRPPAARPQRRRV